MRLSPLPAMLGSLALMLSFAACAKPATASEKQVSTAATAQVAETAPAQTAAAPATTSGTTVAAATAPRPWYAASLEKLGFYVFPAPVDVGDFTVESTKGGSLSLSKDKGKIVLLNFWATWCPPCRAEMPSIQKLWDKRKDKAFDIIAVSVGEQKDTVAKFIAENKYSYPTYLDPNSQLGTAFNASSIPTTYIIDKNGKVIAGTQGSREYDSAEVLAAFDELIAK